MTQKSSIELNQAICTIAEAAAITYTFPGVQVEASETFEWRYDITTPDRGYNRYGVTLDRLVVEVKNAVAELQSAFGEHGERLGDLVLDITVNAAPMR